MHSECICFVNDETSRAQSEDEYAFLNRRMISLQAWPNSKPFDSAQLYMEVLNISCELLEVQLVIHKPKTHSSTI